MDTHRLIFVLFLLIGLQDTGAHGNNTKQFPRNFRFGVASSAYQVEGGWNTSDKSESIWDYETHNEPQNFLNAENGDVACDSYHQNKRDVEMLRDLGVDFYRFSISWTRILPSGFTNYVSKDGVSYYNNLINELLKYNIQPVVTIYHWDLPQSLQELGGWTNPLIVTWFEDYASLLFELFGDRVKTWITINEPHSICYHGYEATKTQMPFAPFLNIYGIANYLCAYNVLKSHAAAYHIYNDVYRPTQKGQIGLTIQLLWISPATDSTEDIKAASDFFECKSELYLQPIFGAGGFPSTCIQLVAAKSKAQGFCRSRLPQFTTEEISYIKGTADFLGVNHYSTIRIYSNSSLNGPISVPSWMDDFNVFLTNYGTHYPSTSNPWYKVVPEGFREALNHIHKKYNNITMFITENGFSTFEGLNDEDRIKFYKQYLNALLEAILVDGVNVIGYTYWSLMDNFEWIAGYSLNFGLYEVDFTDPKRKRTPKKSALVYKEIIKTRIIEPDYKPEGFKYIRR